MSQSFRLATTYQFAPLAIDRTAGILRGITAMQAGIEALGHGVQADMQTLHLLAGMGNADPDGVRTRFGHPGISENATGKKVANAINFQVKGDRLLHDSLLLQSARKSPVFSQDPIEYILEMAEKTPRELGESVVIAANTVWALDDGREIDVVVEGPGHYYYPNGRPTDVELKDGRPVNATTPLPVLRPVDFHFVDFVGEPALVRDGLTPMEADAINYLFGGRASEYAQEMFALVDEWRSRYHIPISAIPGKVDQIVSEYMAARSGRSTEMGRKMKLQEAEVEQILPPIEEQKEEEAPAEDNRMAAKRVLSEISEDAAESQEDWVAEAQLSIDEFRQQFDEIWLSIREISEGFQAFQRKVKGNMDALQRQIDHINGEPYVSERVPKGRRQPTERYDEPAAYQQHPAPRYQMEAPTHVMDRRADAAGVLPTDSPRVAAAKRNMNRAAIVRGSGGGQ